MRLQLKAVVKNLQRSVFYLGELQFLRNYILVGGCTLLGAKRVTTTCCPKGLNSLSRRNKTGECERLKFLDASIHIVKCYQKLSLEGRDN